MNKDLVPHQSKHSVVPNFKQLIAFGLTLLSLFACSKEKSDSFKVAATPVPHAQILEFAKPELAAQGIDLKIIMTEDYNMPNRALAERDVDANFFQHIPFMEEQIQQFGYRIESLAKIELEPLGIYSKKIHALSQLKPYARIAIPNDPTNEARALCLLEAQGLIQLDRSDRPTILNITNNSKAIKFIEADPAMIPRSLDDVDAAIINANFALEAGLHPAKDALVLESRDSLYANIIAIRIGDEDRPEIQALKTVMTSEAMKEFIDRQYKGALLPAL